MTGRELFLKPEQLHQINVIITRLIGGLGNQMFQYAAGRKAAKANNTELKLDIFGFKTIKNITPYDYSLKPFKIQECFATQKEVDYFKKFAKREEGGVKNFFYNLLIANSSKYVKENRFVFDEKFLNIKARAYLEGHWASEKYFMEIKDIILKEFTLKEAFLKKINQSMLKKIRSTNSVSLHVRRGDYAYDKRTNKHHGLCSLSYYYSSSEQINKKINNPYFFIFSDDIDWVGKNLKLNFPTTFVSGKYTKKDYEDLTLMKNCKHHITANSTFSWWAAWLPQNSNKIVCAPKKWFNIKRDLNDFIPKSWIRI